jgi:hypothetical protein
MSFDTDDLSDESYKAIMLEAERFHHDLTLQFGLLSTECTDENMFIEMSEKLVKEMLKYDDADIDDMFFGDPPEKKGFHQALKKILSNISKLKRSSSND